MIKPMVNNGTWVIRCSHGDCITILWLKVFINGLQMTILMVTKFPFGVFYLNGTSEVRAYDLM